MDLILLTQQQDQRTACSLSGMKKPVLEKRLLLKSLPKGGPPNETINGVITD